MVERRGKRDDLVSVIRLWVTQTYGIGTDYVKLAQSSFGNREAVPDNGDCKGAFLDVNPSYGFATTLSVPLIMTTKPNVKDSAALDGVCLLTLIQSSLLQLIAQDIFGIFVSRIADIIEPLTIAKPWTRRS